MPENDRYDELRADYAAWKAANGLTLGPAHEHVFDRRLNVDQRDWLLAFCMRWNALWRPNDKTITLNEILAADPELARRWRNVERVEAMASIPAKIAYLFAFAVLTQIAIASVVSKKFTISVLLAEWSWPIRVSELVGSAVAFWIMGGLIPLLVWASFSFRSRSANAALTWWAGLIALFGSAELTGLL